MLTLAFNLFSVIHLTHQILIHIITQGQYCDICTSDDTNRAHPISNAIDGTERWWQSPPLSRSAKHNEVNVTLDLGQVCYRCIPDICLSLYLSHTHMHVLYCVEITQRTVGTSDTWGHSRHSFCGLHIGAEFQGWTQS